MTTIKKVFTELNDLLLTNKDALVSDLMPQLTKLMSSKVGGSEVGSTFLKDDQGNVIAIYCYYHKQWELLSEHQYGIKVGSTTGYNSMCKLGVNQWTTQQRVAKKAREELLTKLQSGELTIESLPSSQAEIEEKRNSIVYLDTYPKAYATIEDLKAAMSNVSEEVPKAKKVKKAKVQNV